MRTAGLPTFRKLYGRNNNKDLVSGEYELSIEYSPFSSDFVVTWYSILDFAVKSFGGTKSIVISTSSWLGGKNPFLGIAYMVVGGICIVLGIIFLVKHKISPR